MYEPAETWKFITLTKYYCKTVARKTLEEQYTMYIDCFKCLFPKKKNYAVVYDIGLLTIIQFDYR